MSRRRAPRTLERHLDWANDLRLVHRVAQTMSVELGNAYPVNGKEYRAASRVADALVALRSALENAAARDLGEQVFRAHGFFHWNEPRNVPMPPPGVGLFGDLLFGEQPRGQA